MQELHLPDGKPVAVNPEAIGYVHALGDQATLIGFAGGATITVHGSYEEVLIELGLLDHPQGDDEEDADDDIDLDEAHGLDDEPAEEIDHAAEERALEENRRGFF